MRRSIVLAIVTLALTACEKSKEQPPPPAASVQPVAVVSVPVQLPASAAPSATAAAVPALGLFADKLPAGLVDYSIPTLDLETMKRSRDTDTQADKALKRKDYAEATRLYVEALKIDPANRGARFRLARTLVLNEQGDAAIGVLDQFYRANDCFACQGLLLKAAQTKDFAPIAARPEFKERTENVGKKLPTIEAAARQVLTWLGDPRMDNLPSIVDSRTFIVLEQPGVGFKQFLGVKAFLEYVVDDEKKNFPDGRKWGGRIGPPNGMSYKCPNECCEINTYESPGRRNVLRQLCFTPQGGVAIALSKLKVD